MPEGQKRIYYLGGPDFASVAKSPNLEIFRRKGLEVLFLTDPIDEFAITVDGARTRASTLTSIDSADLELPDTPESAGTEPSDRGIRGQGERVSARPRPVPRRAWRVGSRRSASRSG